MQSDDLGLVAGMRGRAEALSGEYDKRGDSILVTLDELHIFDAICRLDEGAAAIERLVAERDDLRTAISTPAAVHANMLRGGIPLLTIRQVLHLHGSTALATWDNAEGLKQAAATYFERYCQDEADDVENCVAGEQQHRDAIALRDALATLGDT